LDHPFWPDDHGFVAVVDLEGKKKTFSSEWDSEDGLAWAPGGDEIWFTAAATGSGRALYAVALSGEQREVLRVPGELTLQDISPDGKVLLSFDEERSSMRGLGDGETKERDLSWFDYTLPRDISPDGKWVLFNEESAPAGPNYIVGLRKMDGSPPVRLGEGLAGCLSPDARWAIAISLRAPQRITLLPTGPGEPKEIQVPGIEHFGLGACFSPDGQHLIFSGFEQGQAMRTYIEDLRGGNPKPITPESVVAPIISPDGKYVAGLNADRELTIYPVEGGEPHTIPGLPVNSHPIRWAAGGQSLYVYPSGVMPVKIYRADVATGQQQLVKELMPPDPAGLVNVPSINIKLTPDAKSYVYAYLRYLSELYVVDGLK